jgi:hypothetical protein
MISCDDETLDDDNTFDHPFGASIFLADTIVVFDGVFVPHERVFMDGERGFFGDMAYVSKVNCDALRLPQIWSTPQRPHGPRSGPASGSAPCTRSRPGPR